MFKKNMPLGGFPTEGTYPKGRKTPESEEMDAAMRLEKDRKIAIATMKDDDDNILELEKEAVLLFKNPEFKLLRIHEEKAHKIRGILKFEFNNQKVQMKVGFHGQKVPETTFLGGKKRLCVEDPGFYEIDRKSVV
jgi:hypothetical protein